MTLLLYGAVCLLLVHCVSTSYGEICVPTKHKMVSYQDSINDFGRKTFGNSKEGFYRSMIIDGTNDRLIVGAKDHLHVLNPSTLNEIYTEKWTTSNVQECVDSKDIPNKYCGNYITNMDIYKNQLVVCGTGSTKPTYKILSLSNYTSVPMVSTAGSSVQVCASPNPDHRVTGKITNLGEMIAATFKDISGEKSEVVSNYVTEKMSFFREGLTTSRRKSIAQSSTFVNSFNVNGSVYIFFMESAKENDGIVEPTVGRFCQTDSGGVPYISATMWTTFRKSRLHCNYNTESDLKFNNLVDIVYDDQKNVFYAAFTMTKTKNLASAVCAFTLQDIEASIEGDFLVKDSNSGQWKPEKHDIFNGCQLNANNMEKDNSTVIKTLSGKEPTDYMDYASSTFISKHHLMARDIKSKLDIFHFVKPLVKFSRIAIDRVSLSQTENATIVSVIDEHGNLLNLYGKNNSANDGRESPVCVIEEVETRLKNHNSLLMNEKTRMLYVSSDEGVYAYNVDSCHRYETQRACVDAHNPRCGWGGDVNKCISWHERSLSSNQSTWIQNLTKCPERQDFFSSWLPWTPCQQGSSERYCLCRQRQCRSCDVNLCGLERLTEVINCTVNPVKDVNEWLAEGAIDGQWSNWEEWSPCEDGSCGNDTKIRYRQCSSPAPANGGSNCQGNNFECTTCPKKQEVFHIFWSGWGSWSDCIKVSKNYYEQSRSRECSKPDQCKGEMNDKQQCVAEGMIWGEWTNCSCYQRVQHRYPVFITGCKDCPRMKMPEYRICDPVGCPSVTKPSNDTNENSTSKVIVVKQIPADKIPINSQNKEHTFRLKDIVIIACGIVLSCFVIIIFVIFYMRRREKMQSYSPGKRKNKAKKGALLRTDTLDPSDERCSNASSV